MSFLRTAAQLLTIAAGGVALFCGTLWYMFGESISPELWQHLDQVWRGHAPVTGNRTPGELIRYTKRRLEGHPNLESLALPPLNWLQSQYERPVPSSLPTMGKGQQDTTMPQQQYDPAGRPLEVFPARAADTLTASSAPATDQITVDTVEGLIAATNAARAGRTIVIAPGLYRLKTRINTNAPGTPSQPITVRAEKPGQVRLEFDTEVAFRVSQPYWIFENMQIRGVCDEHSYCEHAFHIYGAAQATVVRNNLIEDFNAHLKVNGASGNWPDNGLVQYNTLTNTARRATSNPVTLVDLVGANQWRLSDNLVSNFVKGDGNQISYGLFMKGASRGGRIERNLVICTPQAISQTGVRVGISYGGGTTRQESCRDQRCEVEHTAGLAANNIVAHCNDSGIDVNKSSGIFIAHNTLVNTAGIVVRNAPASATLHGNLLEGQIHKRNGGQAKLLMNELVAMGEVLENSDALKFLWRKVPDNIPSIPLVPLDFYGVTRSSGTKPGALN